MKKIMLLTAALIIVTTIKISAQTYEWVRTESEGGEISREVSNGSVKDDAGNLYVIGTFGGSNGGSTQVGSFNLTSTGKSDVMLIKYDPSGNCIWVRQSGSINYEYIYGLEIDKQGNIYISGRFGYTIGGGPVVSMFFGNTTVSGYGKSDCFAAKYNTSGDLIWAKSFGGPGDDQMNAMSFDHNGNLYLCGSYQNTITFGNITLNNNTNIYKAYLAKMTTDGNFVWVRNTEGSRTTLAADVSCENNSIVITGWFYGTITAGNFQVISHGESDIYIIKYDDTGNEVWMSSFGSIGYDQGYRTDINLNDEIFLTGSFDFVLDLGKGITVPAVGGTNTYLCKFDRNGNPQWVINGEVIAPQGFSGGLYPADIITDSFGNCYLTGYFDGGIVFDGDTLYRSPAGLCDSYLIKFSGAGEKKFIKQILSGGVADASYTFCTGFKH